MASVIKQKLYREEQILGGDVDTLDITPPAGAKIYTVTIRIEPDQLSFRNMIRQAGPNTPPDANIWGLSSVSVPIRRRIVEEQLGLLWGSESLEKSLGWASEFQLPPANVSSILRVGTIVNLHEQIGMGLAYVLSPRLLPFEGSHRLCAVRWCGSERKVSLEFPETCDDPSFLLGFLLKRTTLS